MFKRYPHLERITNDEVEGILVGEVHIFPKIDGTNSQVWLHEGTILAGSRNRTLSVGKDNQGFLAHILEDDRYEKFFQKFPQRRLYGEWLVPHTLQTYRKDCWRKFYVFDVLDEIKMGDRWMSYEEYKEGLDECGLDYIPPMVIHTDPNEEDLLHCLAQNTYLIEDGKGLGEGIVMKRYGFVSKYGRTTWAKLIRTEFKDKHTRDAEPNRRNPKNIEREIVEEFLTQAVVDKVFVDMTNTFGPTSKGSNLFATTKVGWKSKMIPEFLNRVWHEFIVEETWDVLKKHKLPTINYKTLRTMCTERTKELKQDVF